MIIIRVVIENEAGEANEPVHLDTPSAQQSGLKLKLNEALEPGYSYTFILDWDVQKSIVKAGNSGKYNLKPVIRVNAEVNSGSIAGKVVEDITAEDSSVSQAAMANVAVEVYAYPVTEGDESIATTMTNENGEFQFMGLDAGDYVLEIKAEGYSDYESENPITVVPGEISDAGIITLILLTL